MAKSIRNPATGGRPREARCSPCSAIHASGSRTVVLDAVEVLVTANVDVGRATGAAANRELRDLAPPLTVAVAIGHPEANHFAVSGVRVVFVIELLLTKLLRGGRALLFDFLRVIDCARAAPGHARRNGSPENERRDFERAPIANDHG